ncbi:unnamed protein product [Brassica oleracea]
MGLTYITYGNFSLKELLSEQLLPGGRWYHRRSPTPFFFFCSFVVYIFARRISSSACRIYLSHGDF